MGSICIEASSEQKLQELENLLADYEEETSLLKEKVEEERERQRLYNKYPSRREQYETAEQIDRIINEKNHVFKTMLKARKLASELEDEIQQYKIQLSIIQQKINDVKQQIQAIKDTMPKPRPRRGYDSSASENDSNSDESPKKCKQKPKIPLFQSLSLRPILSGEQTPDYVKLLGLDSIGPLEPMVSMTSMDNASTTDDEYVTSEDDGIPIIKTTELLDVNFDPEQEASTVHRWLHAHKIDTKNKREVKQLKMKLAELLTSRSEGYRQSLLRAYYDKYNIKMEKDIKSIIKKGHAMRIIHGLLLTRAQFDAILVSKCVTNWDILAVADIICCRSVAQLKEINVAYHRKCKLDIKKQLQALAQKDNKQTLVKVIGSIFDFNRKENKDLDMNKVDDDLKFMLTQKNFKGETKERLVLIFTANDVQYIKVLNGQFKLQSKDSLEKFIDKKLGPKSSVGHFCKTRIQYALDTPDYYARKIKELCKNYKKNHNKISDIFIQRMEIDLDTIKRTWIINKYGDGKNLKQWIMNKSSGSKSGYFLIKMLDNCGRYIGFQNTMTPDTPKSKIEKLMM